MGNEETDHTAAMVGLPGLWGPAGSSGWPEQKVGQQEKEEGTQQWGWFSLHFCEAVRSH